MATRIACLVICFFVILGATTSFAATPTVASPKAIVRDLTSEQIFVVHDIRDIQVIVAMQKAGKFSIYVDGKYCSEMDDLLILLKAKFNVRDFKPEATPVEILKKIQKLLGIQTGVKRISYIHM